jgi:hypothetical protein
MNVTESQLSQWIAEMDADPSHNYGETFYDVCKFAASAARQASALQARCEALEKALAGVPCERKLIRFDEFTDCIAAGVPSCKTCQARNRAAAALGEDRK